MHKACALLAISSIMACGNMEPRPDGEGAGAAGMPSENTGDGATAIDRAERLLPMAVGASWVYRISDVVTGQASDKTTTVEALEDVGGAKEGITAYRIRTEKLDGVTVSWQEDRTTAIVRHREQIYDLQNLLVGEEYYEPYKVRIDEAPERLQPGTMWTEAYTELRTDVTGAMVTVDKTDQWVVEANDEMLSIGSQTFECVRLHRTTLETGSDKRYWFSRGVGKVKETGGQVEELMSYELP